MREREVTRGTDMGDIHIFTMCTMFFTNVPAPIPTFAGFHPIPTENLQISKVHISL